MTNVSAEDIAFMEAQRFIYVYADGSIDNQPNITLPSGRVVKQIVWSRNHGISDRFIDEAAEEMVYQKGEWWR